MKNEFKTMKIEIYECPDCKDEFYSRAQHDYIQCKCRNSALDGGHFATYENEFDGIWRPERLIGSAISAKTRIIELEVTEQQLYDDWNNNEHKYGRV